LSFLFISDVPNYINFVPQGIFLLKSLRFNYDFLLLLHRFCLKDKNLKYIEICLLTLT